MYGTDAKCSRDRQKNRGVRCDSILERGDHEHFGAGLYCLQCAVLAEADFTRGRDPDRICTRKRGARL
mgnify:CR=1 FL=1